MTIKQLTEVLNKFVDVEGVDENSHIEIDSVNDAWSDFHCVIRIPSENASFPVYDTDDDERYVNWFD